MNDREQERRGPALGFWLLVGLWSWVVVLALVVAGLALGRLL